MLANHSSYSDHHRPEMIAIVPRHCKSAIDVGAETGAFARDLRRHLAPGSRISVVEPGEAGRQIDPQEFHHVIRGFFPTDLPDDRFDCMVFNDVLEHMEDPWSALEACKHYLEPGGVVIASIPNVAHLSVIRRLMAGRFDYNPHGGIMDITHLRFFTRKTIIDLFTRAGFEIELLHGIHLSTPLLRRPYVGRALYWLLEPLARHLSFFGDHLYKQFAIRARVAQPS